MSVTRNMELRHLSISDTARLSQILDNNDSWKSLMEKIPKNLDEIQNVANDAQRITRKYSADNIKQIDSRSKELNLSPTQILLDEWGTSGKKRATVSDLLEILIRVQLYRAADFVAKDILREAPPKRPENGPGARIDVSMPVETFDEQAIERILNNVGYPYTSQLAAQMIEKSIDSLINNNNRDFGGQPINMDHHQKFIFNNSSELHSDQFESDTSESDTDLIKFSAAVSASAVTTSSNSNNNSNHININSNSNNNDGEPLQVPQPTVFPTRPTGLSSSLSSNASTHSSSPSSASSSSSSSIQSASSSMLQMMNDCILPANLPMAYSMNSDDDKHSNVTATNEIETTTNTVSSSSSSSSVSGVSSSYTCSTASNQTNQSTLIPDLGKLKIRDRSSEQQLPPLLPSSPPPPLPQPQSLSSSSLVINEQHMPSPSTPSLTHSGINGHSTMSTNINNDDAKNLSDYIPNLSLLNGTGS